MIRGTFRPLLFGIPIVLLLSATVFLRAALPSRASSASITLSLTYGPPTSSVLVKGNGFKGSETVSVLLDTTPLKSVLASKAGIFSVTVTIPGSALPGNHLLQAKGKSSGANAQKSFLVQTDWVQQGFNREHTSNNVFENVLSVGNVNQLTQRWWYSSSSWSGPIVAAQGAIYLACYQTYACALSGITGQLLWSHNLNETVDALPAVANNLVYLDTTGGHVTALNMTSGTLAWSYFTGSAISDPPLTANGLVYVGASNGVLYALNGTTGQVVWTHAFPSSFATPSIDSSLLYLSAGGSLYALNSQTGQTVWHVAANGGTPIIANGMIYLNDTADNKLLALSEKTGALLWSRTEPNYPASYSNPSVANGVVYVTVPHACNLEALSGNTGAVLWQYNTSSQSECLQGDPIVANGVVYDAFTDDYDPDCYCGGVYAFSAATGAAVGGVENYNGDWPNSVVVVNGTLYYGASGSVYAYSPA